MSEYRDLSTSPNGTVTDNAAVRAWLRAMDKRALETRPKPVRVARLSALDPMIQEFNATSRERPR